MSLVTTLVTLLLVKGLQSHGGVGGVSALAGLFAFAIGAGLVLRSGGAARLRALRVGRSRSTEAKQPIRLPAGVDRRALLRELRGHFFELQAAWDRRAPEAMGLLTTPDMLAELWAASSAGSAGEHPSEFLSLQAEILLFEERGDAQIVCVEYSGMVREAPCRTAAPFREFWMLTRSREAGSGWRLARHQGLL